MVSKDAKKPALRRSLERMAQAILDLVRQGLPAPVIVGGAAVSLATGEAISTGDIDVVYANDQALARSLVDAGFQSEDRVGHLTRGFYDPETSIGVEAVGSRLFDGRADERRCIAISAVGGGLLRIPAIEDLVADRAGQFDSGTAPEMLLQVRSLLDANPDLDEVYLAGRLAEESGNRLTPARLRALIVEQRR
jgi:hypothetical protein